MTDGAREEIMEAIRSAIKSREQTIYSINVEIDDLDRLLDLVRRLGGENSEAPSVKAAVDTKPQPAALEKKKKAREPDPSLKCNQCRKQCLTIKELIVHKKTHRPPTSADVHSDLPPGPQSSLSRENLGPV